ncbi:Cloroperoxidase, partial [Thelephora ganbajun]
STSIPTSTSHSFIPPSPSDLRSPCPALNALANHGHINRDGRDLTVHALVDAMRRVYNFTKPLAYLLALAGVFLCGDGRTVDLDRLAKHNVIEHDASLSRQDTRPPNDYSPILADLNLVAQLMHVSPNNFLVLNDLAMARVIRESQAVGGPLSFPYAEIAKAESGLILQVLGDESLEVDKDVLCTWLVDGRLPDSWEPPKRRIGIRTTASVRRCIA